MTTLLIVEDNEMNVDMLSQRLKRKGFQITVAMDGEKGIKLATETFPQLILMDLSLPVIDGWEAARLLKCNPVTQAIPIIALSAHAMEEDRDRAIAAGCDDYDSKPINLERLLDKIRKLLEPL